MHRLPFFIFRTRPTLAHSAGAAHDFTVPFLRRSILGGKLMAMRAMGFVSSPITRFAAFDILSMRNRFKMLRVYTAMYTTKMVKFKVIGDWANNQLIRNAVCELTIFCANSKSAISPRCARRPKPAPIRPVLIDFSPEAFDRGIIEEHLKLLSGVMRRAVCAVPSPLIISQGKLS